MEKAFFGCSNLQITATAAPNLSNVTDLSEMFKGATSMNAASLKDWDVSNVTDMTGLFSGASAFNQSLAYLGCFKCDRYDWTVFWCQRF